MRSRNWEKTHPKEVKERQKISRIKFNENHPELIKKFNASIQKKQYQKRLYDLRKFTVFQMLGEKCNHCGSDKNLEIDHIYNDGKDERTWLRGRAKWKFYYEHPEYVIARLQILCRSCNRKKAWR